MADTKRDESRDLKVYRSDCDVFFIRQHTHTIRALRAYASTDRETIVYVPYSDLEVAQRRIAELEKAANDVVSFRDSCVMCEHTETRKRELEMYRSIDRLESLLPKEPHT